MDKEHEERPVILRRAGGAKGKGNEGGTGAEAKQKEGGGKPKVSKMFRVPASLTPEQIAWIDSHWEAVCRDPSKRYPGTLLFELAKDEGVDLSWKKVTRTVFSRLAPLGERIKEEHPEQTVQALTIWYTHEDTKEQRRDITAAEIGETVGLTALEIHGVLCRYGHLNKLPKWLASEVEKRKIELGTKDR